MKVPHAINMRNHIIDPHTGPIGCGKKSSCFRFDRKRIQQTF